jgi:hypothetical protein
MIKTRLAILLEAGRSSAVPVKVFFCLTVNNDFESVMIFISRANYVNKNIF